MKRIKMATLEHPLIKSKFRGSLIGSLLGDCLGAPYEGDTISPGDKIIIQRYFDQLESPDLKGPIRCYTDDTAMTKSVAKALIETPDHVDYKSMAKLFVKEYFIEPQRGYGQNVIEVFHKLRKDKFEDIYKPAKEQFNGSGSYGNGGAMRIAPLALYFYNKNENLMIDAARKSTQITHTNELGVNGAILQCLAVNQALGIDPKCGLDSANFCDALIKKIRAVEKEGDDGLGLKDFSPYEEKLNRVKKYLKVEQYDDELEEELVVNLGNSISAYESVPTAIYCFLKALNKIPTITSDSIFRRTIQYAISFGGDTDTIASMAGAIAGAYLGEDDINKDLVKKCEFNEEMVSLADDLFKTVDL